MTNEDLQNELTVQVTLSRLRLFVDGALGHDPEWAENALKKFDQLFPKEESE